MSSTAPNEAASYASAFVILFIFGLAAVYITYKIQGANANTEEFITARKSQPFIRIFWSLYAGSIGAWVVFLPASYTSFGGWISIITYGLATGLPLLFIAEWGALILKSYPDTLSLNDFVGKRYGRPVQLVVVLIELFNMAVTLTAEFTAIGDLFQYYVGSTRIAIIVYVACVTSIYTAVGGLRVSIITDQAQAVLSLVLILLASIYLAATFHEDFPTPLPENLAANFSGYSSIFALPVSMISAALFTESFWQRVWAAESTESLRKAGWWSCGLTSVVISFFGLIGFLGQWAGLQPLDDYNNLAFFVPFTIRKDSFGVILVILAATMNESSVDSLQNAIVATVASNFFIGRSVWWPRILTFLINIPVIVVAVRGVALLDMFLIMNIITVTQMVPLVSGIFSQRVSGTTVLVSGALSMASTIIFGIIHVGGDVKYGFQWTFSSMLNAYDYRIFLVAFISSIIFVALGVVTIDRNRTNEEPPKKAFVTPTQEIQMAPISPPSAPPQMGGMEITAL